MAASEAIQDEGDKASALSAGHQTIVKAGQHTKALQVLRTAFRTSRLAGRDAIFRTLKGGTTRLACIDDDQTLWKIWGDIQEGQGSWRDSNFCPALLGYFFCADKPILPWSRMKI